MAWAGSPVNTGYFDNVAIMGYDTVAYFTDGRATKGSEEFAYDWLGATWQFANAEHRDLRRHPDPVRAAIRRLVRLGRGQWNERSVNVDPEAWRIVDGKLYLSSATPGWSRTGSESRGRGGEG